MRLSFLKKLKAALLVDDSNDTDEISSEFYKICIDCEGTGHADVFAKCETCEGEGYVRKSYEEYVKTLPPR